MITLDFVAIHSNIHWTEPTYIYVLTIGQSCKPTKQDINHVITGKTKDTSRLGQKILILGASQYLTLGFPDIIATYRHSHGMENPKASRNLYFIVV